MPSGGFCRLEFYEQTMPEMRQTLLFLFLLLLAGSLSSQDIHYSQFYNQPLNVNPGKTGIFNGDKRVNLSYRSQWRSVPVPWTTFSGSFDRKFYPKYGQQHFFSAGVLFNYDLQGELQNINLTNINVTGSWTKILNEQNLFTIGALIGYATRGFDTNSLTFDSQWNGAIFDGAVGSGENFTTERIGLFENALGVNYRWQKTKRTKLDLGLAGFHLIRPSISFLDTGNQRNLGSRFTLTGIGSFEATEKLDIQLNALYQTQESSNELILSGLGKIYINQNRGKELELHIGFGWRSGRSIFPIVALQHRQMYFSLNYDVDVSDFNEIHNVRPTSFEAHFSYIITDVKPKVKVCPIF